MQAEKLIQKKLEQGLSDHAYLLISNDQQVLEHQVKTISDYLKIHSSQTIEINPEDKRNGDITIGMMRELKKQLSLSISSGYRLVVINQADKLNIAAANSFLKTLEEPPRNTIIILLSNTLQLLPTIISRCQLYQFPGQQAEYQVTTATEIGKIESMSLKERFDLAEKIHKSTQVPQYLNDLRLYYHQKFLEDQKYSIILRSINEGQKHLESFVSQRLVLENILLILPGL